MGEKEGQHVCCGAVDAGGGSRLPGMVTGARVWGGGGGAARVGVHEGRSEGREDEGCTAALPGTPRPWET